MAQRIPLRKEISQNYSGKILHFSSIPLLKNEEYLVKNYRLDGDAPKQFIRAYFYVPDSTVRKSSSKSWPSYIAKTAEKWYPHESVIEYMINRIGQELGLVMNEIRLVKANDQIRFLSRYFLRKDERLVHGAEICGQYLNDMPLAEEIANNKNTSRELFTFEFIKDAVRNVYPNCFEVIMNELVRMIIFDAIVGNNDRHFYNWGVVDSAKKSGNLPTLAPLYDSARGLLLHYSDHNCRDHLIIHRQNGKKVVNYIENASPRISIEENKQANHFQLVSFLKKYNNDYREIVNQLSSVENQQRVLRMLEKEFYPFFIPDRSELVKIIVSTRFEKIRSI